MPRPAGEKPATRGLNLPGQGGRSPAGEGLAQQKRETSEAVEAFLLEAEDVANSGGIWGRLGGRGRSAPPPRSPISPARPPQAAGAGAAAAAAAAVAAAAQPGTAGQAPLLGRGEQCLDAFGASAKEARPSVPSAPANPKRPPGTAALQSPLQSQQPALWQPGPSGLAPRPLEKLKAGRAPPPLRAICGGPLGLFLLSALSFALLWQVWPLPCMLTVFGLILALHVSLPQPVTAKGRFGAGDLVPCGVCACAAALGPLTGIYAHEAYTSHYYIVALGREYHNVLASSSSAAYGDAGKLHFANTSGVDYTRVLGYQNHFKYCVAPVVDSGPLQTTRVGFWAVGVDCCGHRGDFACGDAGASATDVKGGARAPQDGIFESPRTNFIRAIEQAAAVYNLEVDPDPVLLHWVKDPAGAQRSSILGAFGVVLLGAAFFVLLAVATLAVSSVTA